MTFFGNIASIEKTLAPKQKAVKTLTVQTGSLKLTWNVTVCNKCPRRPLKLTTDPWPCPWTWPWSRNIRYCKWVSFFIKPHLFFEVWWNSHKQFLISLDIPLGGLKVMQKHVFWPLTLDSDLILNVATSILYVAYLLSLCFIFLWSFHQICSIVFF